MGTLTLPVLVLNKNWVPIRVTTVMDAITKLFEGRAKAIDANNYQVYDFDSWSELAAVENLPYIVTARNPIRVPDVIVLIKYGEIPEKKLTFSRANIYRRDKYTCQYCGDRPGTEELTIDHIVAKSRGGKTSWTNCVVSCISCNRRKADRTMADVGLKLRSQPVKPTWSPRLVLQKVRNTPKNWDKFVSDAYWHTELEHDD